MEWVEIVGLVSVVAAVVAAGAAVLAWVRAVMSDRTAKASNIIAQDALTEAKKSNQLAERALAEANQANCIATESNQIAREGNQIQHEVKHAQTMPALKAEQIEALKSLHRKTHNNLRLPGTTNEIAEEWEGKIKNLAYNVWQEWEHVLSRDPALGLPMKADEVKRIINEFCARAKMTPLP